MNKKLAVVGMMATIALLLGVGPAQAATAYLNEYTYGGNTIDVFTLSPWSGVPGGATILQSNVAWGNGSSWTVPANVLSLQVLVVGGGGGSAGLSGGGGGGGTYTNNSYGVTPGNSMTITVGAGGVGTVNEGTGNNGSFSQFGSQLFAYGGYYGQDYGNNPPQGDQGGYSTDGGSTVNAGFATFHWLNNGTAFTSGAGGGAAGTFGNSENGAVGLQCAITGVNQYYAGGGGAPVNTLGGLGGGGNGANPPTAGALNTGGGAGGGFFSTVGANGGSGVVIVAYQAAAIPEPSTLVLVGVALVPLFFRRSRKSC